MDKFGQKPALPDNVWWKSSVSNFNKICERLMGYVKMSIYMYICKLDFIVVKCGRKLELHYISNFNTICGTVYVIVHGKVHSWFYANWGS
jgi:hypothetical protein